MPYTMVNVLNFELRANEVGIPPTYDPWVKGLFLSEPQYSLCKRQRLRHFMGLFERLDDKRSKDAKSAYYSVWHIVGIQQRRIIIMKVKS